MLPENTDLTAVDTVEDSGTRPIKQADLRRPPVWEHINRWRGVALSMILAVATLWLAWSNLLTFFIHPRYVFFTVEMALLALLASVWAIWRGIHEEDEEHGHDHSHHDHAHHHGPFQNDAGQENTHGPDSPLAPPLKAPLTPRAGRREPRQFPTWLSGAASALVIAVVAGMVLVAPPAPLSATLASERALAGGGVGERSTGKAVITTLAQLPDQATVGDWAQLLANAPAEEVLGQKPVLDGFIIAPEEIADHGYYLVRFQIACCAVDALPVGIPVVDPAWRDKYSEGQWLRVSGEFTPNPGMPFPEEAVLTPSNVETIDEPEQPYLF